MGTSSSVLKEEQDAPSETSSITTAASHTDDVANISFASASTPAAVLSSSSSCCLYEELRDMAAVSFLAYTFGYILDVARSNKNGLIGLEVDSESGHTTKSSTTTRRLQRSFTPTEVLAIIQDNQEILAREYPSEFGPSKIDHVRRSLLLLQQRASQAADQESVSVYTNTNNNKRVSTVMRPLTLIEYDDKHQQHEMVYAVCKDDVNKRITLLFRGTENELSFGTNWTTNLSFAKVPVDNTMIPDDILQQLSGGSNTTIYMHSGFYNYVFGTTHDQNDHPTKRKYDEILEDLLPFLQDYPGYKLYCTGHSLGAALSTVVAFFLSCDDSNIRKPITCLNFASPRVGDGMFLEATHYLQQAKRLRLVRVVNAHDSIAMVPMWGYQHVGFQVRLNTGDSSSEPEITYPKPQDTNMNRFGRAWNNSLLVSLNFGYDHGNYREIIDVAKDYLEHYSLQELYKRNDLTGFEETNNDNKERGVKDDKDKDDCGPSCGIM